MASQVSVSIRQPKIRLIYHSLYGHVKTLIDAVAEGARAEGATVEILRVAETLPEDVLEKMHAKEQPHNKDVPVAERATWFEADGFVFGTGTRFGMMSAQMKTFFDSTGGLWASGGLTNKYAGVVTSTATLGGGQETTALTMYTQFVHHGMLIVPSGYGVGGPARFALDEAMGGSPYGPGTFAGGDGSRKVSERELIHARDYGKRFAQVVAASINGSSVIAAAKAQ